MPAELMNSSAVIVAHDVNMSIFKPPWLVRQKILTDEELEGDLVVTPVLIRIPTPAFELLILPDRIQMRPGKDSDHAQSDLLRVLGGVVGTLPHTPFTAIGLNFEYRISVNGNVDFGAWNTAHFAAAFALKSMGDEAGDGRFGAYFSFEVLEMRLKADLKPVRMLQREGPDHSASASTEEKMQGHFNFHRDLGQRPVVSEILEALGRWDAVASIASQLATEACACVNES